MARFRAKNRYLGIFELGVLETIVIFEIKCLRATEIVQEIKFEGVWGDLEAKMFPETITHKISETDSGFHVKVVRQLARQLTYTMFISNNCTSFHFQ